MKPSNRAMFYSGLVFPGLGQWVMGRRLRALLIVAWELLLLFALFIRLFVLVYNTLYEPISNFQLPPDLIAQVHKQAYVENWWLLALILAIWIWSVIDAWLIGKKIENGSPGGG
ncbi:MAG TPA: hypothetical protein VM658_04115 [bacterium]|nr:hypothetical protein [bacterium]